MINAFETDSDLAKAEVFTLRLFYYVSYQYGVSIFSGVQNVSIHLVFGYVNKLSHYGTTLASSHSGAAKDMSL